MKTKSLTKNSLYNVTYTVVNVLFPFITSVYVSRILLPAGVGRVAYAQNLTSYFVTLAALGLQSYGIREFAKVREKSDKRNKLFTELFLVNIISTSLSCIAFALFVWSNGGFERELGLYVACGLTIFLNYLNIDWLYQGVEEYGYITARSMFIKVLSVILLFLLVKDTQDYVLYALISSLATGGNYIFNVIRARKFVCLDFSNIQIKKHIKPIITIACIVFLSSIYSKIDTTMLGIMGTEESVGYYTYAQKILNIVISLANAVTISLLPRLSFYYDNERTSFYTLINKAFQVLCFMVLPLTVGLFMTAPQIVELLYGKAFEPAGLTIRLMCPLILIKSFGDLLCYQLVYSTKNEKIIIPAAMTASIMNIIVNALLIPKLLQNGAVIASVLSELITNLVQFLYIQKKIRYHLAFRSLLLAIISTTFMGIAVAFVLQMNLGNVIKLFFSISAGMAVYLLINLVWKNEILIHILKKIKLPQK